MIGTKKIGQNIRQIAKKKAQDLLVSIVHCVKASGVKVNGAMLIYITQRTFPSPLNSP